VTVVGLVTVPMSYMIAVEGAITADGVQPDADYGWKFWLDDGSGKTEIYINRSTDIEPLTPALSPRRGEGAEGG
jgi:hypothetical protein